MVRYLGKFPAGTVVNDVMSHLDWVPTIMAAVGEPEIKKRLLKGYSANGRKYKIHLDGYDFMPRLTGKEKKGPRNYYIYGTDSGKISAIRFDDRWKAIYMEQKSHGTRVSLDELVPLKAPLLFDLRMDPFEKALHTNQYLLGLLQPEYLYVWQRCARGWSERGLIIGRSSGSRALLHFFFLQSKGLRFQSPAIYQKAMEENPGMITFDFCR